MRRYDALRYRGIIEQATQSLDDASALNAVTLYPHWTAGVDYPAGHKVQHDGKLWRCIQGHTSIVGWEPVNVASLWEQINETRSGTEDDPIPYSGNMALISGLYYTQDSVVYCCVRDTINPVYNRLDELVGLYVEKV